MAENRDTKVTPQEALLELATRKARNNLACFTLYTFPKFKMGWFHREVCRELDEFLADVVAGKSPRLILTAPPRHGKSQLVSREFPAYLLGRYPDMSVIACSYSSELSTRMNRDVQRIMDSPAYHRLFDSYLAGREAVAATGDNGAYERTTKLLEIVGHQGSYRSAGVGNGITGTGCDILIVDDPFKDRKEAYSETVRDSVYGWYTSTASTRLSPGGGIIVMCTRWHQSDLVGRLLSQPSETPDGLPCRPWKLINYPAIAEHDEKYRREGEALHPDRYPLSDLREKQATMPPSEWAALYQQRPIPAGGGVFKEDWINYYTTPPAEFDKIVLSWDMTFKDSDGSDYVVGAVWARAGGQFYLLDQVRGRWDFVTTMHQFIALSRKHKKAMRKLVEDKANGSAIIDTLKTQIPGIIPVTPTESKEARASAIATLWEAHNVFLPSPEIAPWIRSFTDELLSFPAGAHDDQVDAMTQALQDLQHGGRIILENILALRGR